MAESDYKPKVNTALALQALSGRRLDISDKNNYQRWKKAFLQSIQTFRHVVFAIDQGGYEDLRHKAHVQITSGMLAEVDVDNDPSESDDEQELLMKALRKAESTLIRSQEGLKHFAKESLTLCQKLTREAMSQRQEVTNVLLCTLISPQLRKIIEDGMGAEAYNTAYLEADIVAIFKDLEAQVLNPFHDLMDDKILNHMNFLEYMQIQWIHKKESLYNFITRFDDAYDSQMLRGVDSKEEQYSEKMRKVRILTSLYKDVDNKRVWVDFLNPFIQAPIDSESTSDDVLELYSYEEFKQTLRLYVHNLGLTEKFGYISAKQDQLDDSKPAISSTNSDIICNYCKKKGHIISKCRQWLNDGKPPKPKPAQSTPDNTKSKSVNFKGIANGKTVNSFVVNSTAANTRILYNGSGKQADIRTLIQSDDGANMCVFRNEQYCSRFEERDISASTVGGEARVRGMGYIRQLDMDVLVIPTAQCDIFSSDAAVKSGFTVHTKHAVYKKGNDNGYITYIYKDADQYLSLRFDKYSNGLYYMPVVEFASLVGLQHTIISQVTVERRSMRTPKKNMRNEYVYEAHKGNNRRANDSQLKVQGARKEETHVPAAVVLHNEEPIADIAVTSPANADNHKLNDDDIHPHEDEVIDMTNEEPSKGNDPMNANEDGVHDDGQLTCRPNSVGYGRDHVSKRVLDMYEEVRQLHIAEGCIPYGAIANKIESGQYSSTHLSPKIVREAAKHFGVCAFCAGGKAQHNSPTKLQVDDNIICIDIMFIKGKHGKKIPAMIGVHKQSGFVNTSIMKSRSAPDVRRALDSITTFIKKYGFNVDTFHSDREAAFVSIGADDIKITHTGGINDHEYVAESYIRRIKEIMRCIICSLPYKLPSFLYTHLMHHATILFNHRVGAASDPITPFQIIVGSKLSVDEILRGKFGRIAMFRIDDANRDELQSRSEFGIVIGFEPMNPSNLKVYLINRDVIVTRKTYVEINEVNDVIQLLNSKSELPDNSIETIGLYEEVEDAYVNTLDMKSAIDGNMSIKEALQFLPEDSVNASVIAEMNNMYKYNVFTFMLSDFNHKNINVLPAKMFVKVKYTASGTMDKVKSRLVAGGHRQDDDDLYRTSTTVDLTSILTLLVANQWSVACVDVPAAYLNADLNDNIYMRLNKSITDIMLLTYQNGRADTTSTYVKSIATYVRPAGDIIVKLNKCLYGLKQSSVGWEDNLTSTLTNLGFSRSKVDRSVFYKTEKVYILIHVDDLLIIYDDENEFKVLKDGLQHAYGNMAFKYANKKHAMTYGGEYSEYIDYIGLSMNINNSNITISQKSYLEKIIRSYELDRGKTLREYVAPSNNDILNNNKNEIINNNNLNNIYIKYLYSILYVASRSRPDVLGTCIYLTTMISKVDESVMALLDHMMGYIKCTINIILNLSRGITGATVTVYADASYGIHHNGRSHTGIVITLGNNGPVCIKSEKQKLVTLSSTEAEIEAATHGIRRGLKVLQLLQEVDIQVNDCVLLLQDNKSTISIITNGEGFSGKSRFMRVKYHFVSELAAEGKITIRYCPTDKMCADIVSKPCVGSSMSSLRDALMNMKEYGH